MNYTRRDLSLLLPLVFSARAKSATTELPSQAHPFDQLPMKQSGENKQWAVLDGMTHAGCPLEVHITNLPAGGAPHPPHHHVHEEMILVQEGTMEVTISGKSTRMGPGSVAFVHSNEEHGWKNVGDTRAQYFVIAIGREKT
ncbi:MAG: cupin domain-containing protein [Bryobacteraceae bacterium]